jgi:hypothetical protein
MNGAEMNKVQNISVALDYQGRPVAVYLNSHRIAGPKPWGLFKTKEFKANGREIRQHLKKEPRQ